MPFWRVIAVVSAMALIGVASTRAAVAQQLFPSLEELAGSEIEFGAVLDRTVQKSGQVFASQLRLNDRLRIGAGGTVQLTSTATSYSKGRTHTGKTNQSRVQTIDKPGTSNMGRGEGHVVWIYDAGVLAALRTYKSGGVKRAFTFSRTADGVACKYEHAWLFEDGRKTIEVTSAVDGLPLIILNYRQTSSYCRIRKAQTSPI